MSLNPSSRQRGQSRETRGRVDFVPKAQWQATLFPAGSLPRTDRSRLEGGGPVRERCPHPHALPRPPVLRLDVALAADIGLYGTPAPRPATLGWCADLSGPVLCVRLQV